MKIKYNGYTLTLSEGNSKIGKILNFSLPPGRTCTAAACASCLKQGCYAFKFYRMRKHVRDAWDGNLQTLCHDYQDDAKVHYGWFVGEMAYAINKKKPKAFRWHVGGDFFSKGYFRAACKIAKLCPDVKFYAYTKAWDVIKGEKIPENFTVICSEWPGCPVPKWAEKRFPITRVIRHGEQVPVRKGAKSVMCTGDCSTCNLCMNFKKGTDVVFVKH